MGWIEDNELRPEVQNLVDQFRPVQQLRQFGDARSDPPPFVSRMSRLADRRGKKLRETRPTRCRNGPRAHYASVEPMGKFRDMNGRIRRSSSIRKAPCRSGSQAMKTEKTNGEFVPPAITSFSPVRSGASSRRK